MFHSSRQKVTFQSKKSSFYNSNNCSCCLRTEIDEFRRTNSCNHSHQVNHITKTAISLLLITPPQSNNCLNPLTHSLTHTLIAHTQLTPTLFPIPNAIFPLHQPLFPLCLLYLHNWNNDTSQCDTVLQRNRSKNQLADVALGGIVKHQLREITSQPLLQHILSATQQNSFNFMRPCSWEKYI